MSAYVNLTNCKKSLHIKTKFTFDSGSLAFFLFKSSFLLPVFFAITYLLSSMFINSIKLRIIFSIPLCIVPWKELMTNIYSSKTKLMRSQLLVMFQVLCTSVSSGYSIEKSLCQIRPIITHTFGKKSPLIKPLIMLENDLNLHRGLEKSLNNFANAIKFPQTIPIFHALGLSGQIGNSSLAILRSSCQMLSDLNAVENEISASNAGKNAEALILCIMPFAVTFSLNKMSSAYINAAKNTKIGGIMLLVAFIICIISCGLLFRFMSHKDKNNMKLKKDLSVSSKSNHKLTKIMQKIMPSSYIASRHELFNELSFEADDAFEKYLSKVVRTCIFFFTFTLIVIYVNNINPLLSFLSIPICIVISNKDLKDKLERRKIELMDEIPLFLCLMTTLLQAGLQLPKSIDICSKAFNANKSLSSEIKHLRAMIISGSNASDAIENMSLRIQIPEAQSAFLLLARYGRLGGSEVLNLLAVQSASCWNLCRNAARKKQEKEALGLLFPMTLDFVAVLLVAITPAIISLGI